MKKMTIVLLIMCLFIFSVSCQGEAAKTLSEAGSAVSEYFVSREDASEADDGTVMLTELNDIIAYMCGNGHTAVYKEASMIGDALVEVFSVKGESETAWLFAHDGQNHFYIDRVGDGNWRAIGRNDNGQYYIGKSAVITHTEDEYILFVEALSDDIFGISEDRDIVRRGSGIFDEYLLVEYSVSQGNAVVGYIALNDTVDVVYIDRGSGEYERFSGDLSKYQAKG